MVVSYMVVPAYDLTILTTIKFNQSLVSLSILCSITYKFLAEF